MLQLWQERPEKYFASRCPLKGAPGTLPALERLFRSVVAICYGLIWGPTAPMPSPTLVQHVGIDVTHVDDQTLRELVEGGAVVQEMIEEEKEDGSTA